MEENTSNLNDINNKETPDDSDVSALVLDLIQDIQTKLNNNQEEQPNSTLNDDNYANSSTNTDNSDNIPNLNSNNIDFSNVLSMLKGVDISSLIGNITKKDDSIDNEGLNFNGIDANMIGRVQKLLSSAGKKDPKKNLLISLKPFLRKSRQDKLGEYISILTIINALDIFNSKGGDKDV